MAKPEADRRCVDEAQEAFGGLVVAGGDTAGILELIEAPLDNVPQSVEPAIDSDTEPARFAFGTTGRMLRASMVLRTLSES